MPTGKKAEAPGVLSHGDRVRQRRALMSVGQQPIAIYAEWGEDKRNKREKKKVGKGENVLHEIFPYFS